MPVSLRLFTTVTMEIAASVLLATNTNQLVFLVFVWTAKYPESMFKD